MDPPDLDRLIAGSTRWRAIEHHASVGSTNTLLLERARAGDPVGLVVVADHQTAGRGRRDRRWEDEPGRSLLISCLLSAPPQATLVPLAAGLAVADAARSAGAEPRLKWPNDVLVDDRKVAGILVEVATTGPDGAPSALVVGMGTNVDLRGERTGDAASWTSLAEVLDRDVDRWALLGALLGALDGRLTTLEHDPARLRDEYRAACATLGRDVQVGLADGVLAGRAEDIDDGGALLVRAGDRAVAVSAGDVTHVRRAD